MVTPENGMETTYDRLLHEHIADVLASVDRSCVTFADICRACEGAFPSIIWSHLPNSWRSIPLDRGDHSSELFWVPELSPVRAEWYYTRGTLGYLAQRLKGSVLLVGAPSLANEAGCINTDTTLVDDSPWASLRFDFGRVSRHCISFNEFTTTRQFETVLVDPPWYFPTLKIWLERALRMTTPGGITLISIPGRLTRPTAPMDQRLVLDIAQKYGNVSIERQVLEYAVPVFEREALKAAGVPMETSWRRADLVVVERNARSFEKISGWPDERELKWADFMFNGQIVSVRQREVARHRNSNLLGMVDGVRGKVLDTVSRRDPRLALVDIWTSRNRVASASDPAKVIDALKDPDSPVACEILDWLEVER
jgi:hypothetical protein